MESPTFNITTLGCPVNQSDSDEVKSHLIACGLVEARADHIADIYIINSCIVTQSAARKTRKEAIRARKVNKEALICLMGCYGEMLKEELASKVPELDLIVGTDNKSELLDYIIQHFDISVKDYDEDYYISSKMRPVVKIQEGCHHQCSYCIVTFARGKSKSKSPSHVLNQVNRLLHSGYKEIILAGTNMGLYGKDLNESTSLEQLLDLLATLSKDEYRIRLSSLEPMEISDNILHLMAKHDSLCNHLYLPLQSGSDKVLTRMKRPYNRDDYARIVQKARKLMPNINIMADLIVGFPGETEIDHQTTLDFIRELKLSDLHVFQYSNRPFTEASQDRAQVRPDIIKKRANEAKSLGNELAQRFHQFNINKELRVLIEKIGRHNNQLTLEGFSDNYCYVKCNVGVDQDYDGSLHKGEFIRAKGMDSHLWGINGALI